MKYFFWHFWSPFEFKQVIMFSCYYQITQTLYDTMYKTFFVVLKENVREIRLSTYTWATLLTFLFHNLYIYHWETL